MYANLKMAMAVKGVTIESIARLLGIHRNTVANKLDGDSEFTFSEAYTISEAMFPESRPSYLFKRAARTA